MTPLPRKIVAFDSEGSGLNPYVGDYIHRIAFYASDGEQMFEAITPATISRLRRKLAWADACVAHNIRHDAKFLRKDCSIDLPWPKCYDTMVMARLMYDQEQSISLLGLSLKYLEYDGEQDLAVYEYNKRHKCKYNYTLIPDEVLRPYTLKQLELTLQLFAMYWAPCNEICPDLFATESALPPVLVAMEDRGVVVSRPALAKARAEYEAIVAAALEKLQSLGCPAEAIHQKGPHKGKRVEWENSSKRVGEFLLSRGIKLPKTLAGNVTTSAAILSGLLDADPAVPLIQEIRHAKKLIGTFVDGITEKLVGDTIHVSYLQPGTRTGRMSCSKPNFTQMPHEEGMARPIKCAIRSRKGYMTVSIDFKSLQLRMIAGLANDTTMIEILESGRDLHYETALYVFHKQATMGQRFVAKAVNFGIPFGAGLKRVSFLMSLPETANAYAMSKSVDKEQRWETIPGAVAHFEWLSAGKASPHDQAGCPVCKAEAFLAKHHELFPGLWKYRGQLKYELEQVGYIEDPFGRRHFPEPKQWYKRINLMAQGMEANVAKSSMVQCARALEGTKSQLLLMVHDELVFEFHRSELHLIPIIRGIMESQCNGKLPIGLKTKAERWAPSWGEHGELPRRWSSVEEYTT